MSGAMPAGEPLPPSGALPPGALESARDVPLSAYVHIPFCSSRCGYCDFNTYTPAELGGDVTDHYVDALVAEIALAGRVLGEVGRPLASLFTGGGTPSLLDVDQHVRFLDALGATFGWAGGAELTTEANPESVSPEKLTGLRAAGYTRISLGMQSSQPHVLGLLDRKHTPERALQAVAWARSAGFEHVNLDLIHGTPGESLADWRASLEAVLSTDVDHVSAYSLIVEDGTPLARAVRRGEIPMTDEDDLADKYELAEELLTGAGFVNYETSNWARPGGECRHNLAYWHGTSWWGFGAGAHSHVGGVRWWNAKRPQTYAEAALAGLTPSVGHEVLGEDDRRIERVLLELRLAEGLPLDVLTPTELSRVDTVVADGLGEVRDGRLVLTFRGRLLADAVIRDLLE